MVKTNQSIADVNRWLQTVGIPEDSVLDDVTAEGGFLRLRYHHAGSPDRFSEIFLNSDGRPVVAYVYHVEPEPKVVFEGTNIEVPKSRPARFAVKIWILILYVLSFFGRKKNG